MTRRPILCLNGKPTRYEQMYISFIVLDKKDVIHSVEIDHMTLCFSSRASVSYGTRPSGRRIVWVHVPEVVKL